MSASKRWPDTILGTISFLEDAGAVRPCDRLSCNEVLLVHSRSMTSDLTAEGAPRRQAPGLPLAVLMDLELIVVCPGRAPVGLRYLAWCRLAKSWGCLRFSDLQGLQPGSLRWTQEALVFHLNTTKTTGPGKQVSTLQVVIARDCFIFHPGWLTEGLVLMEQLQLSDRRDYMIPSMDGSFTMGRQGPMPYGEALVSNRILLTHLRVPEYDGEWRPTNTPLILECAVGLFTEHSERHVMPDLAARRGFLRPERDYLGRWSPSASDAYLKDAKHTIIRLQRSVALAARRAEEDVWRNEDCLESMMQFLTARGLQTATAKDLVRKQAALFTAVHQRVMNAGNAAAPMDGADVSSLSSDEDGKESNDDDGFGDEVDEPRRLCPYDVYWLTRAKKRVHLTGAPGCRWDPRAGLAGGFEWISSLSEARMKAESACRYCWPMGLDEDSALSSDDELLSAEGVID